MGETPWLEKLGLRWRELAAQPVHILIDRGSESSGWEQKQVSLLRPATQLHYLSHKPSVSIASPSSTPNRETGVQTQALEDEISHPDQLLNGLGALFCF